MPSSSADPSPSSAAATTERRPKSQAYELFILVLTVMSLVIMVVMLLPVGDSTLGLLQFYDNLICVIFLIDFGLRLTRSHPKSVYLVRERGWLDLVGSIPSFGSAFRFTGLFRLARLSRLARITRLMRSGGRANLARDILANRSKYALWITVLMALIVLCAASVLVLQFESRSVDATITTGWDAFWFSVVTITTVGYGDLTPITVPGRIAAMFIMIAGLGIIGALASILASVLLGSDDEADAAANVEISALRGEVAELRVLVEAIHVDLRASGGRPASSPD